MSGTDATKLQAKWNINCLAQIHHLCFSKPNYHRSVTYDVMQRPPGILMWLKPSRSAVMGTGGAAVTWTIGQITDVTERCELTLRLQDSAGSAEVKAIQRGEIWRQRTDNDKLNRLKIPIACWKKVINRRAQDSMTQIFQFNPVASNINAHGLYEFCIHCMEIYANKF